jgi:hypothetical protein
MNWFDNVVLDKYQTILKILYCVNCEPINKFTKIYPSETSAGFLFNLSFGVSFLQMYLRYSDVAFKKNRWREIWKRDIEGI